MTDFTVTRTDEYAAPFANYVQQTPKGDIRELLAAQLDQTQSLLRGLTEQESLVRHAPYTWSVKQVIGHIADCERVFGHRVLWIARRGGTPLASFDETVFMQAADFDRWPFDELLEEFELVRRSHLALLKHLEPEAWLRRGVVLDQPTTVRAMARVMYGHAEHHLKILRKRLGAG
jgi:hypothetical protein